MVQRGDFTVAIACVPCGPRRSLIYAWAWGFCVCWKLPAAEKVKPDCCHTPAVVSTLLTLLPVSCPLTTPIHYNSMNRASHHVIFSMGSCQSMNCASHPTWWTPSPWRSAGTALVAWRMWSRTSRKLSFCRSNGPTSSSTPLFSSLQKVRKSPSCSLHCSHVCIFCYVWRLWIFSCSFVTVIVLVSWGHRYTDFLFVF